MGMTIPDGFQGREIVSLRQFRDAGFQGALHDITAQVVCALILASTKQGLGLFEPDKREISELVSIHDSLYYSEAVNGAQRALKNLRRVWILHSYHFDPPRPGGMPARRHPRRREAGEDADHRNPARRGHVLSSGIVSYIKAAAGDSRGEAGERAFPAAHVVRVWKRPLNPLRFFAAGAFVDEHRHALSIERSEQF